MLIREPVKFWHFSYCGNSLLLQYCKKLSSFSYNELQVKTAIQETESATPPVTIMAENFTSATTTQVTKVNPHSNVLLAAKQDLLHSDSWKCILLIFLLLLLLLPLIIESEHEEPAQIEQVFASKDWIVFFLFFIECKDSIVFRMFLIKSERKEPAQ